MFTTTYLRWLFSTRSHSTSISIKPWADLQNSDNCIVEVFSGKIVVCFVITKFGESVNHQPTFDIALSYSVVHLALVIQQVGHILTRQIKLKQILFVLRDMFCVTCWAFKHTQIFTRNVHVNEFAVQITRCLWFTGHGRRTNV